MIVIILEQIKKCNASISSIMTISFSEDVRPLMVWGVGKKYIGNIGMWGGGSFSIVSNRVQQDQKLVHSK